MRSPGLKLWTKTAKLLPLKPLELLKDRRTDCYLAGGALPVPTTAHTPVELFTMILAHKLRYAPEERDMVVLSQEVLLAVRVPLSSRKFINRV